MQLWLDRGCELVKPESSWKVLQKERPMVRQRLHWTVPKKDHRKETQTLLLGPGWWLVKHESSRRDPKTEQTMEHQRSIA